MATNFNFIERNYIPSNNFNFGLNITTYRILAGSSKNFTSIWADPTANLNTAKMYVATAGNGAALSIIDLEHTILYDSYTISEAGINGDTLDSEGIVDINVGA